MWRQALWNATITHHHHTHHAHTALTPPQPTTPCTAPPLPNCLPRTVHTHAPSHAPHTRLPHLEQPSPLTLLTFSLFSGTPTTHAPPPTTITTFSSRTHAHRTALPTPHTHALPLPCWISGRFRAWEMILTHGIPLRRRPLRRPFPTYTGRADAATPPPPRGPLCVTTITI